MRIEVVFALFHEVRRKDARGIPQIELLLSSFRVVRVVGSVVVIVVGVVVSRLIRIVGVVARRVLTGVILLGSIAIISATTVLVVATVLSQVVDGGI